MVLTGASGLGLEMTQQLLDKGHRVVATVRQAGALTKLAQEYGDRLDIVELDLVEPESTDSVVKDAFQRHDRIEVIVSNAAYGLFGAAEELTNGEIYRQIATNLAGSIHLIRGALPLLRRHGGGRIVQVSSEGRQIAYPGFSLYHASKWGIEAFVEAVAQEVAPFGVVFIIAEPGPTGTNFGANLVRAEPMDVHDETPPGVVRQAITECGPHRGRNHVSRREREAATAAWRWVARPIPLSHRRLPRAWLLSRRSGEWRIPPTGRICEPQRRQKHRPHEQEGDNMSIRSIISALALSVSSSAFAQTAAENQVVGTWRMMSATIDPGGKNISAYGEKPNGLLVFTPDMHFVEVLTDADIPRFTSNARGEGTDDENRMAMSRSIGFFGTYTVDEKGEFSGNRVEGATFPNWVGSVRTRDDLRLVVEGDRMTEQFRRPEGTEIRIEWQRVK